MVRRWRSSCAGPLGAERTAQIGAALADGLAYAHGQGIVHRDVKPSNILMGSDGNARLGDFGIARLLDGSTLTVTGTTLGTAAYMAPEQIEDHQVGAAADVWSLGMVLLECLTGHRVYEGSPAEIVGRRRSGPVPVEPGLPVPWKLLLGGMLERRPDQRLDSAQVATLLATSPFREPWEGSAIHRLDPTAAMATATPTAIPDPSPLTSRGIPTVILLPPNRVIGLPFNRVMGAAGPDIGGWVCWAWWWWRQSPSGWPSPAERAQRAIIRLRPR